jgi:glycosyltransferase involved in cell wall biosynthesis
VIGTIAPLRREKRVDRLIEAFAQLAPWQNVRLVIGGDGPERPALEGQAAALGIGSRTTFVGHVLKPEFLLPHFDLFAITSDTEQMPFGVIEAMAAGLPVVATDVGDIRVMLTRSNGPYIVERDDPDHLVAALRHLAGSPALREEIGIENRKRASAEFELERMSAAYDAIFQRARSRGAGRAVSPASAAGQAR